MLVAINDRIESSRSVIDVRSSVHYFTTGWNNNWVINSDVLYDDEKAQYYENINNAGSNLYARNILNSPKTYYIEEIKKIITGYQDRFFDENENNISFYIEYTNPNVLWTNTTAVTDLEKNEISSSYQIKKILNKNVKCHVYTEKVSPAFVVPSGFGPYQIKAKTITSAVDKLSSFSNVAPHNYPFEFNLNHSKISGGDNPKSFSATIKTFLNVEFQQNNTYEVELEEDATRIDDLIRRGRLRTARVTGRIEPGTGITGAPKPVARADQKIAYPEPTTSESQNTLASSDANNAFVYTGDISQGNTWDEYFQGKGSGTFVRYIKLTMHHAGYNASSPSNGTFNASLSNEVKAFQRSRGIPADGIVDSRTKEEMAFVWSNKTAEQLEATRVNVVDNNKYGDTKIWDYVNAASQVKTAAYNLARGFPVKMINFTGSSKASNQIKMWVSIPLSNDNIVKTVKRAVITPTESFGPSATSYKGIRILDWNVSDSAEFSESFFNNKAQGYQKNGVITITLDSPDFKGKWLSILLEGSVLGGTKFGPKAAGLAIDSIDIIYGLADEMGPGDFITAVPLPDIEETFYYWYQNEESLPVTGVVEVDHDLNNISFNGISQEITLDYIKNNGKLKSIELYPLIGDRLSSTGTRIPHNGLNVELNNNKYKPDISRSEVVDISNPKRIMAINSSSLVPGSVKESGTSILSNDDFIDESSGSSTNSAGQTTFSISASSKVSSYSSGTTYNITVPISGYSLKKVSNNQVIAGKNQANYYDGTMLLTNSNGTPFFPLNLSAVSTTLANTEDSYYSDIKITKVGADTPGLEYGFYDTRTNQFIGRTITYLRYMQSPSDIYIGVYAYDYDGNLSTLKEFTSSSNGSSYIPTSVPLRAAYPIFNVISNNRNKIQLFGINGELNKTEPWPLSISSGSFQKTVNINPDDARGWKSSYSGQDLIAAYDTSSIGSIPWSRMFGRGYYDIIGERPLYNNPRSINLRQTPLHVMKGYSSDLTRKNVPLKPALKVYTRTTETSPWSLVPYSQIVNFNADTGLIEFRNQIISNNEALTKVDYTIEYNRLSIKQSAGVPIPTNPFLNKDTVQLNKPLYIYVLPQKVFKSQSVNNSIKQIEVTEYPVGPAINFTYNNNIFNKFDQASYDPFAQLIGIIYVINTNDDENFNFTDLRVKGGGISANFDTNTILDGISQAVSYWDIYPPMAEAYPKGGYVMVKIPSIVKKNFINPEEVYDIVRDNLTAGVVFDLYDTDGKDWGSSVTTSS
jgi:peptidoglycan hydrolase-like protein with peptidoglycan-binding domain